LVATQNFFHCNSDSAEVSDEDLFPNKLFSSSRERKRKTKIAANNKTDRKRNWEWKVFLNDHYEQKNLFRYFLRTDQNPPGISQKIQPGS
jgi:hypothetical protein